MNEILLHKDLDRGLILICLFVKFIMAQVAGWVPSEAVVDVINCARASQTIRHFLAYFRPFYGNWRQSHKKCHALFEWQNDCDAYLLRGN